MSIPYPGHVLKAGTTDVANVREVQLRLRQLGLTQAGDPPIPTDGSYGSETAAAVRLLQARSTDSTGVPLKVDGEVGPLTWSVLFGGETVPSATASASQLLSRALQIAGGEVGTMEIPRGSNRGPRVDQYQTRVGLTLPAGGQPGFFWCAAFVYWCFDEAAKQLGIANPVIRTAGVIDHWNRAGQQGITRITGSRAKADPGLVLPGHIFVLATDNAGHGHTGIVEAVEAGRLTTIEGNSNEDGSANGIGVFRRTLRRKIADINRGFIAY